MFYLQVAAAPLVDDPFDDFAILGEDCPLDDFGVFKVLTGGGGSEDEEEVEAGAFFGVVDTFLDVLLEEETEIDEGDTTACRLVPLASLVVFEPPPPLLLPPQPASECRVDGSIILIGESSSSAILSRTLLST